MSTIFMTHFSYIKTLKIYCQNQGHLKWILKGFRKLSISYNLLYNLLNLTVFLRLQKLLNTFLLNQKLLKFFLKLKRNLKILKPVSYRLSSIRKFLTINTPLCTNWSYIIITAEYNWLKWENGLIFEGFQRVPHILLSGSKFSFFSKFFEFFFRRFWQNFLVRKFSIKIETLSQ